MPSDGRPAHPTRRADIQGLRGVAVLLVVAYHSGLPLRGGWVGVDVFLVISGFVIGRLLLGELHERDRVDLVDFAARRVRRLLPALATMVAVTLVVGALVRNPTPFGPIAARTGAAALGLVANLYLYRHTGYFGAAADDSNPFLHTWSLSLEEQFYLLLPVTLALSWALGRRLGRPLQVVRWVLGFGGLASLGLAIALTTGTWSLGVEVPHRLAFFLLPTRAWEFAVGLLLATTSWRLGPAASRLALAGGAALVLAAAVLLDGSAPFAAAPMVLPVAGAALVLLAGAADAGAGGPLAHRWLVWVGDRSYSWYLWHWPAIALARTALVDSTAVTVAAGILSLAPAMASYRFVEHRYWRRLRLSRTQAFRVGAAFVGPALVVAAVAGVAAERKWGVDEPLGWYHYPPGADLGCHIRNEDFANDPSTVCIERDPDALGSVLVLGSEQADSLAWTARVVPRETDLPIDVAQWSRTGCPFLLGAAPHRTPACEEWNRVALDVVEEVDPDVVVIANCGPCLDATEDPGDRRRWADALAATLRELARRDVAVVLVQPGPDYGTDFPRDRVSILRPTPTIPTLRRDEVERQRAALVEAERAAADRSGARVEVLDPVASLCTDECRPVHDGSWTHHGPRDLNRSGAELLAPDLAERLRTLLGEQSP